MVSFPDGKIGNNALGYCVDKSRDPDRPITLSPIGSAWPKRAFPGMKVTIKWLKLPGQPEFLHVLEAETSTTSGLPRRFRQRAAADLVTIRIARSQHYATGTVLYYGTASALAGNMITVTPLGRWLHDLPVGAAVELVNLSAPGNALKNGVFGSQAAIAKHSSVSATFLKDSPGG